MPFTFTPNRTRPPRGDRITKVGDNGLVIQTVSVATTQPAEAAEAAGVSLRHGILPMGTNCSVCAAFFLCQKFPTVQISIMLIISCSSLSAGMCGRLLATSAARIIRAHVILELQQRNLPIIFFLNYPIKSLARWGWRQMRIMLDFLIFSDHKSKSNETCGLVAEKIN